MIREIFISNPPNRLAVRRPKQRAPEPTEGGEVAIPRNPRETTAFNLSMSKTVGGLIWPAWASWAVIAVLLTIIVTIAATLNDIW